MIAVIYDIEMPDVCCSCPLFDDEFEFCHGQSSAPAWQLSEYRYDGKPNWCPLIEVKNGKEEMQTM